MTKTKGVLKYINPLIDFIEKATEEGHSVLIHCFVGMHRAGTCVCLWLMYKEHLSVKDAMAFAKSKREVIEPFDDLITLM